MNSSGPAKTFLVFLGVAFLPYGLYCFFVPGFLAGTAGLTATTPTGVAELRAMYGGLQAAFGLLMLASARDSRLAIAGLAAAAFVMPGLGFSRLLGVAVGGGVSAYTIGALIFEIGSSVAAVAMLRRGLEQVRGTPRQPG